MTRLIGKWLFWARMSENALIGIGPVERRVSGHEDEVELPGQLLDRARVTARDDVERPELAGLNTIRASRVLDRVWAALYPLMIRPCPASGPVLLPHERKWLRRR